jgi:hypothetical protein
VDVVTPIIEIAKFLEFYFRFGVAINQIQIAANCIFFRIIGLCETAPNG